MNKRSTGMRDMSGFDVRSSRHCMTVRKKAVPVRAVFAGHAGILATLEGSVAYAAGDALLTGVQGERWPVRRERFLGRYAPVPPTLAGEDGLYVKLPLAVSAMRMREPFYVELPQGRLQGQPGDWLLQYGDNEYGIVAREIFEQSYDIIASPPPNEPSPL